MQQAGAEAVVAIGIGRYRQVHGRGVRKFVVRFEVALFPMQFARRFQQQVDDRRRQAVARDEHRLGADQPDFLVRNVQREVDGPGGSVSFVM